MQWGLRKRGGFAPFFTLKVVLQEVGYLLWCSNAAFYGLGE